MLELKELVGGEPIFKETTYTKPIYERTLSRQERVVWL